MTRALCWKEYREQCGTWLLMAVMTALLVCALGLMLAPAGLDSVRNDVRLRAGLLEVVLALAVTYGLVCGARALAGEQESGTMAFLDLQTGQRLPVWKAKALTGAVLALAHALVLASLIPLLGLRATNTPTLFWFWALPVLVLDGFAWGLAGSALGRTVFSAALIGAALTGVSWIVTLIVSGLTRGGGDDIALWASRAALMGVALAVSVRVFCRPDRLRIQRPRVTVMPSSVSGWRVLLWLVLCQGWLEAALVMLVGLFLGILLPHVGLMLWAASALVLSAVCGAATFGEDQVADRCRFLGDQRLPPWHVWAVKSLSWLSVAAATVLVMGLGLLLGLPANPFGNADASWLERALTQRGRLSPFVGTDLFVVLGFLLLHGFAVGQVTGMVLMRRRGMAELVAGVLAVLTAIVWLPSLACGGLDAWQMLVPPLFLLAGARLVYWAWVSLRLASWRPVITLLVAALLAVLWTTTALWYRVAEIPDIGEPFDRRASERSLLAMQGNAAGAGIRQAAKELEEEQRQVLARLSPLRIDEQLDSAVRLGWPKQAPDLDKYLDALFAGKALAKFREASRLPLGLVQDPRLTNIGTIVEYLNGCRQAGRLLTARALQLQARGDDEAALDHLLTALALSRQLANKAIMLNLLTARVGVERTALSGMEAWLATVGPKRELLSRTLDGLTKHEAEMPPVSDSVIAESYVLRNTLDDDPFWAEPGRRKPSGRRDTLALARAAAWEKAREDRMMNLLVACQLHCVDTPYWELNAADDKEKGPVFCVDYRRDWESVPWLRAVSRTRWAVLIPAWNEQIAALHARWECDARATRLRLALALYEINAGKPAARLGDVVPDYLKELPIDPFSGKAFGYRVSGGERLSFWAEKLASETKNVPAGQGILWSTGPDRIDHGGRKGGSSSWPGSDLPRWEAEELDLIYLVPKLSKR